MKLQIGLAEILTPEQEREVGDRCHRIGKAIAHAEAGGMPALAITLQRLIGCAKMLPTLPKLDYQTAKMSMMYKLLSLG